MKSVSICGTKQAGEYISELPHPFHLLKRRSRPPSVHRAQEIGIQAHPQHCRRVGKEEERGAERQTQNESLLSCV